MAARAQKQHRSSELCAEILESKYNQDMVSHFLDSRVAGPIANLLRVGTSPVQLIVMMVWWLAIVPVPLCRTGFADDATLVPAVNDGADERTVQQLIEALGSRTYKQRKRATNELVQRGWEVLPEVESGLQHPDREVQLRCRKIAQQLKQRFRQQQLSAFVANPDYTDNRLPGWELLRSTIGEDAASRSLILSILTEHWELVERFETCLHLASDNVENRHVVRKVASSTAATVTPAEFFETELQKLRYRRDRQHLPLALGHVAAILLMSNHAEIPFDERHSSSMLSILHRFSRASNGEVPWKSAGFQRLVSEYLKRCGSRKNAYQACSLALRYDISEGVVPALAMVESRLFPAHELQYAVLAIAKLGSSQHIEQIETLFDDERICFRRAVNGNAGNVDCQVRDVALAAVLHLAGENPRLYGFDRIQRNSFTVYQLNSLYFSDDETRAAAFARWDSERNTSGIKK